MFWRIDLDLFARSAGRDDSYDRGNEAAQGSAWSLTESALMNVVAAIKAHYRQDDVKGRELLRRGYERVGLRPASEALPDQAVELTEGIRVLDPAQRNLSDRILLLIAEALPS